MAIFKKARLRDSGSIDCYLIMDDCTVQGIKELIAAWDEDFEGVRLTSAKLIKIRWPSEPIDAYALHYVLHWGGDWPKDINGEKYQPIACQLYSYNKEEDR
jgi:hypothetical protein